MTGRERLLLAMGGAEADRVPRALAFYRVDLKKLVPRRFHRDDLIDVQFIRFPLSPEEKELNRTALPYSGDTRIGTPAQVTTYVQWSYRPESTEGRNPLAGARSLDDLRAFPFPDVSAPYRIKELASQVRELHKRGIAAGGNLPHLGGELFEAAWRLRGLENFLIDLARRPDWVRFLLDRLTALACRNAEAVAAAGVDVLSLDDDVGMPGTMMIGPDTWREFFKPRVAEIIRAARERNPDIRVLYHSDGYYEPIVGDLIQVGVDAINPLQPEHMDAARVRKRFGTQVALWGTVGRQTTFSYARPEEIRREVRERIETLGKAGLILCPAYDIDEPDIPWENIEAFLEAVESYG